LLLLNGDAAGACDFAGKTLEACDELSDKFSELLLRSVACYEEVGTIYFNAGLLDQAEAVFNNGLGMAYNVAQGNPSIVPFIPDFLHNLGTIYYARAELGAAKNNLENSLIWYEDLRAAAGVGAGFFDAKLIKNLVNLATTYKAMGEVCKAGETFDRIEQLKGKASNFLGKSPEQHIRYLSSKANLMLSSGEALKASELFEELIPLLEDLSKKYPAMYARELANACLELCAAGLMIESNRQDMERYCGQALEAARRLMVSEPSGDPSPLAYALLYYALYILKAEGKNARCIAAAEEASEIVSGLLPAQGDLQLTRGLEGLMSVLKA
jgi:tetratricopeptide (TPR) repeat protein